MQPGLPSFTDPLPNRYASDDQNQRARCYPNDSRVLSKFITQALRVEPIIVCSDGSQRRSFCYIEEMVEGLVRLMDTEENVTGPVNAGSPRENTILELAETVIELTTSKSEMVFEPLPDDDPVRQPADTKLARNVLAWEPKPPLREALLKTAEYFAELLRGKKELPGISVSRSLDGQPPMKQRIHNHTIKKNLVETRQQTELLML